MALTLLGFAASGARSAARQGRQGSEVESLVKMDLNDFFVSYEITF